MSSIGKASSHSFFQSSITGCYCFSFISVFSALIKLPRDLREVTFFVTVRKYFFHLSNNKVLYKYHYKRRSIKHQVQMKKSRNKGREATEKNVIKRKNGEERVFKSITMH